MEMSYPTEDFVLPFLLESCGLRGRFVRLNATIETIVRQHAYPEPVAHLLAEATVLATVLGSSLKYDGVFTLQTKSNGPIGLLVADVTGDGGVRACAQYDEDRLQQVPAGDALLGKGYLAFTVDQKEVSERYQGIVQMDTDDLGQTVQHYFMQSEQIPTGIVLGAGRDAKRQWCAGALMVQRMPDEGGHDRPIHDTGVEDPWHRVMMLLKTATPHELMDTALAPETLLFRLFHEENVRVFDPSPYLHQCRCSEERVRSMLLSLPHEEVQSLAIAGQVGVTCEFCNKNFLFDAKTILDQIDQSKK